MIRDLSRRLILIYCEYTPSFFFIEFFQLLVLGQDRIYPKKKHYKMKNKIFLIELGCFLIISRVSCRVLYYVAAHTHLCTKKKYSNVFCLAGLGLALAPAPNNQSQAQTTTLEIT